MFLHECVCAYPKEESYGIVEEPDQNDKEEDSKYGADDATHLDLFVVRDEGRGYDVSHQQEIDNKIEDQEWHSVLVLTKKTTPIHRLWCVKELQGESTPV